jgi:protein SCO1/2
MTGTPADIAAAAKSYKVHYAKVKSKSGNEQDYQMEHSSFVYVMGPDGRYVTLFTPVAGQAPEQMALKLRELIGQSRAEKSAR